MDGLPDVPEPWEKWFNEVRERFAALQEAAHTDVATWTFPYPLDLGYSWADLTVEFNTTPLSEKVDECRAELAKLLREEEKHTPGQADEVPAARADSRPDDLLRQLEEWRVEQARTRQAILRGYIETPETLLGGGWQWEEAPRSGDKTPVVRGHACVEAMDALVIDRDAVMPCFLQFAREFWSLFGPRQGEEPSQDYQELRTTLPEITIRDLCAHLDPLGLNQPEFFWRFVEACAGHMNLSPAQAAWAMQAYWGCESCTPVLNNCKRRLGFSPLDDIEFTPLYAAWGVQADGLTQDADQPPWAGEREVGFLTWVEEWPTLDDLLWHYSTEAQWPHAVAVAEYLLAHFPHDEYAADWLEQLRKVRDELDRQLVRGVPQVVTLEGYLHMVEQTIADRERGVLQRLEDWFAPEWPRFVEETRQALWDAEEAYGKAWSIGRSDGDLASRKMRQLQKFCFYAFGAIESEWNERVWRAYPHRRGECGLGQKLQLLSREPQFRTYVEGRGGSPEVLLKFRGTPEFNQLKKAGRDRHAHSAPPTLKLDEVSCLRGSLLGLREQDRQGWLQRFFAALPPPAEDRRPDL